MKHSFFWFRRDLRLEDNTALYSALAEKKNVITVFIFDDAILNELPRDDSRVTFIYNNLKKIHQQLKKYNSSLLVLKGDVHKVWESLLNEYDVDSIYYNKDYEPYAIDRDLNLYSLALSKGVDVFPFKDHVIFEKYEIVKADGNPYTVYTPYKNKWLSEYNGVRILPNIQFDNFCPVSFPFPLIEDIGFKISRICVEDYNINALDNYAIHRDYPILNATSKLGVHLRFGTISIRQVLNQIPTDNEVFISELIWREFFIQVLFHHPNIVHHNFRRKYDGITWLNETNDFERWQLGLTGYPLVDAGMRELNATGYMHNRVRMVTAGFLCKHLLIDWKWGEAYFAQKLLDYELASNNGNWQWAAGTGCDAAPYFRVFNPETQLKKFDKDLEYVKKWVPELGTDKYPKPIIEHSFARKRAIEKYKKELLC
ncbi:cryptochrome/photolyase family protein [Saccharicrinis aurantiacus]|uniref:cryptochrome/photolyase family protein n=1 Tax=Saccharicrinis aurantiacus TaxID=1849719 RepID=UPI00094FEE0B|nr:deoxyribodipyrimidine photo-lyase [Saccharicrinis aurantiacus]